MSFLGKIFRSRRGPLSGPSSWPLTVHVRVPGARVRMDADRFVGVTNDQGYLTFNGFTAKATTIHVDKDGYDGVGHSVMLAGRAQQICFGPPCPEGDVLLPPLRISRRYPAEAGYLTIQDTTFRTDTGAPWQWRGTTSFLLFFRYLRGENIRPLLDYYVAKGFNLVRVLGMVDWAHRPEVAGQFWPQKWPRFFQSLDEFFALLASYGLRCEFVTFADGQIVMPDEAQQDHHAAQVMEVARGHWVPKIEWVNEPFKNIPGKAPRAAEIGKRYRGTSPILMASGASGLDIDTNDWATFDRLSLDYVTSHPPRSDDWPRKVKDAEDWQRKLNRPVVNDEPKGADEGPETGSRSNVPDDFAAAAGVSALLTPGFTFHSTAGNSSERFPPVTEQCADATLWALDFVGPDAQTGAYTAGHLSTCPITHSDDRALRTFGSIQGNHATVVVVRPTAAWTPQPQGGWQIVDHPRRGFLKLAR